MDSGISKSEVSRICAGLDETVEAFRSRPLHHTSFPYVFLAATYLHVRRTGSNGPGSGREMLGLDVGDSEDEVFWRAFLRSLKNRGLTGTRLVISDQHAGLVAALGRVFQGVGHQRSFVNMGSGGMVPLVHLCRRERTGINVTDGGPTADMSLLAVADLDWPVGVVP